MSYFDALKDDIKEDLEKQEFQRTQVEEDDKEALIKEAVKFYNNHPEDEDVFTHENVCVFLIQTPPENRNDEGKLLNTLKMFTSNYSKKPNFLLNGCKFRIFNKSEFISVFGTKDQWSEIGIYDKKALITGKLKERYKLLEDMNDNEIKPQALSGFLKRCKEAGYDIKSFDEIDEATYRTYYSTNIIQVLYAE